MVRVQDQAEIPVLAFLLEPTPADIVLAGQKRPMAQPIPRPAGLLGFNQGLALREIPGALQQGHVLGQTRMTHVRLQVGQGNLAQAGKAYGGSNGHAGPLALPAGHVLSHLRQRAVRPSLRI